MLTPPIISLDSFIASLDKELGQEIGSLKEAEIIKNERKRNRVLKLTTTIHLAEELKKLLYAAKMMRDQELVKDIEHIARATITKYYLAKNIYLN